MPNYRFLVSSLFPVQLLHSHSRPSLPNAHIFSISNANTQPNGSTNIRSAGGLQPSASSQSSLRLLSSGFLSVSLSGGPSYFQHLDAIDASIIASSNSTHVAPINSTAADRVTPGTLWPAVSWNTPFGSCVCHGFILREFSVRLLSTPTHRNASFQEDLPVTSSALSTRESASRLGFSYSR